MYVSIIGTGYVGLVSGVCFAELGHRVLCVDTVGRVGASTPGRPPIFEEGLEEMLQRHLASGSFRATSDYSEVPETEMTFLRGNAVARGRLAGPEVPFESDRGPRKGLIEKKRGRHTVVVKSTRSPNTTRDVVGPLLLKTSGKTATDLGLAMNPEFLKEGMAIKDFLNPDRVVIRGHGRSDVPGGRLPLPEDRVTGAAHRPIPRRR